MHKNTTKQAWLLALALIATSSGTLTQASEQFVGAQGFRTMPIEQLEGKRYYAATRFPAMGASAFLPDADLPAPVRAMLILDSHEGVLPHVRYLVNYQPTSEASAPDSTRYFVEITRFNLGPAVHADLVGSVPAKHLASIKTFGEGPHVRWRFAMSPQRGMAAGLDAVSRKQISAKEAQAMDCLGQPCTQLASNEGPQGRWKPQQITPLPRSFKRTTPEGPVPASIVEQLLAWMGEDAQRTMPFAPDAQRLVFVIAANASGQERQTTGLARNALVFDDAVGTQWLRFQQVAGMPPEAHTLNQRRH
ncbi:MAG: hypothetical protein WBA58_12305 [Giesbergeria sp.]